MLILLLENRIQFLRNKYIPLLVAGFTPDDPKNPPQRPRKRPYLIDKVELPSLGIQPEYVGQQASHLTPARLADRVFEIIEGQDPTVNKIYTEWMLRQFIVGGYPIEDVERLHDAFELHARMKLHRLLPPEETDILKFATVQDFLSWLRSKMKLTKTGVPYDPAFEHEMTLQSKVLLDDAKYNVLIPQTAEAASWFGRDTDWCTAYGYPFTRYPTRTNAFNSYRRGPNYIITNKTTGDLYQFNFEHNMFCDVNDQGINKDAFWKANPELFRHFLVWRGVTGQVDWTKLGELPAFNLVVGRGPNDAPSYRFWVKGTEPPPPMTDETEIKARLDSIPVGHAIFSKNPFADSSMLSVGEGQVINHIDPALNGWWDRSIEGADGSATRELIDWLNSQKLTYAYHSEAIANVFYRYGIMCNGEVFGDLADLRQPIFGSENLSWSSVNDAHRGIIYFLESAGETLGMLRFKHSVNDGSTSLTWTGGDIRLPTYGRSRFDHMEFMLDPSYHFADDLKRDFPRLLAHIHHDKPLTPSLLGAEVSVFLWKLYETSSKIAGIFNIIGLQLGDRQGQIYAYTRFDLLHEGGEFVAFEDAANPFVTVGSTTVLRGDMPNNHIYCVYENGKRNANELWTGEWSGSKTSIFLQDNTREKMKHKETAPERSLKALGPVLWPILKDVLADESGVFIEQSVVDEMIHMPKEDFDALRNLIDNTPHDNHSAFVSTLANLVKHGHIDEARDLVMEHTDAHPDIRWNGQLLIVKRLSDVQDLIEDHGDKGAQYAMKTLEDNNHDYYEDPRHSSWGIERVMKHFPADLIARIGKYVLENYEWEDEDDKESFDYSIDDIIKYGIDVSEVESAMASVASDYARRSVEKDAHDHIVDAVKKSPCYAIVKDDGGNETLVSDYIWDTPYAVTMTQAEVFSSLSGIDPDDIDWGDHLSEEISADKRVEVDMPYNGWDTSDLSGEEEKSLAGDCEDFFEQFLN